MLIVAGNAHKWTGEEESRHVTHRQTFLTRTLLISVES